MTRTETVVDEQREHRGHYVTVEVEATPPLPHDIEPAVNGSTKLVVRVKLYDGPPIDSLAIKSFGGDLIYKNETAVEPDEIRDAVQNAIERAKARIDGRVEQRDTVKSEAEIAIADALGEPEEEGDGDD